MYAVDRTVVIDVPAGSVWDTIVDVDRWPTWAIYMKSLRRLDDRPLGFGSRVKVTPKGLPGGVWTVTEYDAPRSYTWTTQLAPGLNLTGGHVLDAQGNRTSATFSLAAAGPLAAPLSPLLRAVFRRNTRLAAEGLKHHCEQRP